MLRNVRKIKVQIDEDKYDYFIKQFESEQDAMNYLEVSLDNIARKYYKTKENTKTRE